MHTLTPHCLAAGRVMSWISLAMASRFSIQSCRTLAPRMWRNVVWVLRKERNQILQFMCGWEREGDIPFNQCSPDVAYAKRGAVRIFNLPIQHTVDLDIDIVLGHDDLTRDLNDLHLDVDAMHGLCHRIHLDKAWVYTLVKLAKPCH